MQEQDRKTYLAQVERQENIIIICAAVVAVVILWAQSRGWLA